MTYRFPAGGNAVAPALLRRPEKTAGHIATCGGGQSTGVGRRRDEPIGDSLGELMEGFAFSTDVAAELAVIEDQGQGVSEKPDHRKDD